MPCQNLNSNNVAEKNHPYSYDSRKCIDIVFLIILIISDYSKHPVYKLRSDSIQDRHFILSFGNFPYIIIMQFPFTSGGNDQSRHV
ncbi:hypothetical protein Barb6XT_00473 [Bacteroidales bacterium Barb6XT]|nr:hypothetical protein Barb6XT_00473 [Bacteroidales bacterium Barb6XT]